MGAFRALRASLAAVGTCAALMLVFVVASQVQRGLWSVRNTVDFTASFTLPVVVVLGIVGLPTFAVLSRTTSLLERPRLAMLAGAALTSVPAVIVSAAYLGAGADAPQTLGQWIGYFATYPFALVAWLAPYALSGAVFGYVWSTYQDTRVVGPAQ